MKCKDILGVLKSHLNSMFGQGKLQTLDEVIQLYNQ